MGTVVLELKNAIVKREGREILNVGSFVINEGERIAILGPNGAGKSTLIKLLSREIMPLWQEKPPVLFMGEPRPTIADMKKIIGVVSTTMQDQVEVNLTAREVALGGLFGSLGIPLRVAVTSTMEKAALCALEELGVDHLALRDMRTLSTGEARRVLIARALIHDPAIVILDEPCSGLDPEAAYHVRCAYQELARKGRTIILVTHHVEDIVAEMKRLVAIQDGRITADGDKASLLTTPMIRDLFKVPLTVQEQRGEYRLW